MCPRWVFIVLEIQSVFRISFGDRFGEYIKYLIYWRRFGVDSVIEFGDIETKNPPGPVGHQEKIEINCTYSPHFWHSPFSLKSPDLQWGQESW